MNPKTISYILKRILLAILTVWIVITVTFFVMHLVPGGPFIGEKAISPAAQAALEAKYGLDKPLFTQFINYMKGLLKGDFGVSLKNGREISDIIAESFPISARLGLCLRVQPFLWGLGPDPGRGRGPAKQKLGLKGNFFV